MKYSAIIHYGEPVIFIDAETQHILFWGEGGGVQFLFFYIICSCSLFSCSLSSLASKLHASLSKRLEKKCFVAPHSHRHGLDVWETLTRFSSFSVQPPTPRPMLPLFIGPAEPKWTFFIPQGQQNNFPHFFVSKTSQGHQLHTFLQWVRFKRG